jgi:hypothetical protein
MKTGQKVKIINSESIRYGEIGIIETIRSSEYLIPVLVRFEGNVHNFEYYEESDLELIIEEQNKIEDNKGEVKKMRILQIPVKFELEDTFYTIRQVKEEKVCHICEGNKTITYNGKEMKYPECLGEGKFTTNKQIQVVLDEPFIVSSYKISLDSNLKPSIKYKGHCGHSTLNRAEDNLFATKEEAQLKCDKMNRERKWINLSEITIQDSFRETKPAIEKITERLEQYKNKGKFNSDIVVNKNNVLLDGYITYLICKMLDHDNVKVIVDENAVVE